MPGGDYSYMIQENSYEIECFGTTNLVVKLTEPLNSPIVSTNSGLFQKAKRNNKG